MIKKIIKPKTEITKIETIKKIKKSMKQRIGFVRKSVRLTNTSPN